MGLFDRVGRFIDDVLLLPEDVRETLATAEEAQGAELWEQAEQLFEEVLAERPSLARAAVGLAEVRAQRGDRAGARDAAKQARRAAPDDGEVALFTARLALAADDHELAAEAARAAAGLLASAGGAPLAEACSLRAHAEWRGGRPDRAARELRKAISAAPKDRELRVLLVESLADAGRDAAARLAATALPPEELDVAEAARIGLALARLASFGAARPHLEVAALGHHVAATVALARADARGGRYAEAEACARRAIAAGGGPPVLAVLGEVLISLGRGGEASEAFMAAASGSGDVTHWRAAVRSAPLDDRVALAAAADGLGGVSANDPALLAARAWIALRDGEREKALEFASVEGEPRAVLARAELALAADDARAALALIDRHIEVAAAHPEAGGDAEYADKLRRSALRAAWRGETGAVDLAGAIDAVARFADEQDLLEVARGAASLRDELDRPLLLAVLGEFNAGKSTLINAFIGAKVAPMGIVPTTASLNVLRGGAERRVRVVGRDGTTHEGDYEALHELLREAAMEGSAGVDRVEIVLPSETLERIWILDTPGTNALDPDHEKLAKEAARRADAVLWIYDAAQAGKRTEDRILDTVRADGRVVVPVLNKMDRLTADELERVRDLLAEGLGEPTVVALSARAALAARLAEDDEAHVASGFPALMAHLEETIFSRSRELKRAACAGRLVRHLDDALATEAGEAEAHRARAEKLDALEPRLRACDDSLRDAVEDAVRAFDGAQARAFEQAASEVLAFVRPRAHQFARHGADPEDRAFLADVLERRLGAALDDCETRLFARARGVVVEAAAGLEGADAESIGRRVRTAVAPSFAAFWGYQRGLLYGGGLRRFFEDVLPRAELSVDKLTDALAVSGADARLELRPAATEALSGLVATLDQERSVAAEAARRAQGRLAVRVYGPLRALREVLAELS